METEDNLNPLAPDLAAEMQQAFILMDDDGDGELQLEEMQELITAIGQQPTVEETLDLMKEVDEDGNGNLDFEEFSTLMATKLAEYTPKDEILMALQAFDIADNASPPPSPDLVTKTHHQSSRRRNSLVAVREAATASGSGMATVDSLVGMLHGLGLTQQECDEVLLWMQPIRVERNNVRHEEVDYVSFVNNLMAVQKHPGDIFTTSATIVRERYREEVEKKRVKAEAVLTAQLAAAEELKAVGIETDVIVGDD